MKRGLVFPFIVRVCLALAVAVGATHVGSARAQATPELALGVFLPQAGFATNADRSAWADKLAADLSARANGAFTVRAQVFARKEDAQAFAGRVDLLVVDGLFAATQAGEAIAHAGSAPAVGLYAVDAANVGALEGKAVAAAEVGAGELDFYSNTALGGELSAAKFFGEIKLFKDSAAALTALKSRSVAAAFAPVNHPGGAGLTLLAQGGSYPLAVMLVASKTKVDPVRQALLAAAGGLPGGSLGSFAQGGGDALGRARQLRGPPRVLTAPAFVTGGAEQRPVAPPIRLKTRGQVPAIEVRGVPLAAPTLPEPR